MQTQAAKRLFEIYVQSAADTGFVTEGEFTGGCADSGFTAGVGTATICAVGRSAARRTVQRNSCASTAWCLVPRPAHGRSFAWIRRGYSFAQRYQ